LSQPSTDRPITIRLRIFSGRPDPEWSPEPSGIQELARRIQAAREGAPVHAPPEGDLGYRGFEVRGGRVLGLPDQLAVFRGVVSDRSDKAGTHWIDSAGVEGFLLDEARRRGFGQLLDAGGAPQSLR